MNLWFTVHEKFGIRDVLFTYIVFVVLNKPLQVDQEVNQQKTDSIATVNVYKQ